jgi:two-component system, NarL family, nitrate/nitrite response regulator NarL
MDPVRVSISARDGLAREGLAALLGREEVLRVVDDGAEAVLWEERDAELPQGRVVALVLDEDGAARALALGARGALLREASSRKLSAALLAAARGLVVLDDGLNLVKREAPVASDSLTPREHEVLQLLAQGLANKEIAARLHVSEHTAKFHVNAILGKLHAASRTEAVVRAAKLGWIVL